MNDATPSVIVVTGHPASGKSSLARRLAKRLRITFFSKDSIKERLCDELGASRADDASRAHSKALSSASIALLFDLVPPLLRAGESVILEANFKRERDSRALREASQIRSRVIQIVCHSSPEVLKRRFLERIERGGRHAAHDDRAYLPEFERWVESGPCLPLDVRGTILEVNTERFSEALVDQVADDVRHAMRGRPSGRD